jgi:hypothetical protein
VDVADLLVERRAGVLEDSYAALQGSCAVHYEKAGAAFTHERLADLFDLVVTALRERHLAEMGAYCEHVAQQRFEEGFGIAEVQAAFNALEQAMWQRVVSEVPPDDLVEAVGLLTTVFGFGKDTVARRYVSLAAHRRVPTLDLSAMFEGTDVVTAPQDGC